MLVAICILAFSPLVLCDMPDRCCGPRKFSGRWSTIGAAINTTIGVEHGTAENNVSMYVCLSVCLSVCMFVRLCVCELLCMYVCLAFMTMVDENSTASSLTSFHTFLIYYEFGILSFFKFLIYSKLIYIFQISYDFFQNTVCSF